MNPCSLSVTNGLHPYLFADDTEIYGLCPPAGTQARLDRVRKSFDVTYSVCYVVDLASKYRRCMGLNLSFCLLHSTIVYMLIFARLWKI